MSKCYTNRFLEAVDRRQAAGDDVVTAWRKVFREALHRDARMCLCGAMAATSHDLAEEVRSEVRRFFRLGLQRLQLGGLAPADAIQVLATLEGAMLTANVLEDPSLFDSGTETLNMKVANSRVI